MLTVNAVHFRDLARSSDRIICKRARDRSGRVLPIAEMLNEQFLREGFKGGQYEPIDNKPSEIQRAVLDMVDVVHGREQRSSWQREFNRQLRSVERHSTVSWSALEGVAIMSRARGTLSRGFAKKYFRRNPHDPSDGIL